jgi:hypothetical protein
MSDICEVFLCILILDSCFSHAMKNCALSKAALRYFFSLSDF